MRTRTPALLLALFLALLLAACGGGDDGDAAGDAGAQDPGGPIVVEMGDMYFSPDRIRVPAGETVELELTNVGGSRHDLRLDDGFDSGMINPGESVTVEIGPFDADTVGWCDVPGHRAAGMELEIVVD